MRGRRVTPTNDVTSGAKAAREFQSISRQWEEGWSFQLRMQILVLAVILDVMRAKFSGRAA